MENSSQELMNIILMSHSIRARENNGVATKIQKVMWQFGFEEYEQETWIYGKSIKRTKRGLHVNDGTTKKHQQSAGYKEETIMGTIIAFVVGAIITMAAYAALSSKSAREDQGTDTTNTGTPFNEEDLDEYDDEYIENQDDEDEDLQETSGKTDSVML